jgi:hypothetical protein
MRLSIGIVWQGVPYLDKYVVLHNKVPDCLDLLRFHTTLSSFLFPMTFIFHHCIATQLSMTKTKEGRNHGR